MELLKAPSVQLNFFRNVKKTKKQKKTKAKKIQMAFRSACNEEQ